MPRHDIHVRYGFASNYLEASEMTKNRRSTRERLVAKACHSLMTCEWHWFQYHFRALPLHPFAYQMIEAILDCEEEIDGFGDDFLDAILAIRDKNKFQDHYDQLMQRMAELVVVRQSLQIPCEQPKYFIEPTAGDSKKRPDLVIRAKDTMIAIEVKAPACLKQKALRKPDTWQILARLPGDQNKLKEALGFKTLVLPRDNAIKDFLLSADEKFASFKADDDFLTLLIIVWDDYMHEIITSLTHEASGLLTPNSFARDDQGNPIKFPNVDAIIIIRHLIYLTNHAGDADLVDREHGFDFGGKDALPNIFIPNPVSAKEVPLSVLKTFRAYPLDDKIISRFADYQAPEMVFWIDARSH